MPSPCSLCGKKPKLAKPCDEHPDFSYYCPEDGWSGIASSGKSRFEALQDWEALNKRYEVKQK